MKLNSVNYNGLRKFTLLVSFETNKNTSRMVMGFLFWTFVFIKVMKKLPESEMPGDVHLYV